MTIVAICIGERVVAREVEEEPQKEALIILEKPKNEPRMMEVVLVGEDCFKERDYLRGHLMQGKKILVEKFSGDKFDLFGDKLESVKLSEILLVM